MDLQGTSPDARIAGPKFRIDLSLRRRASSSTVYPHGILGQIYDDDGMKAVGTMDEYPLAGRFTTSAQAQGAVEGTIKDYLLDEPFSTAFRFSRFGATRAPARSTQGLRLVPQNAFGAEAGSFDRNEPSLSSRARATQ